MADATMLLDETHAVMHREDLLRLPNYSMSLPTGTTIGKRWRRWNHNPDELGWCIGEYVEDPRPETVGIVWRQALIVDPCTGVTAMWCPHHGGCVCDVEEGPGDDELCPLHRPGCDHAREWENRDG